MIFKKKIGWKDFTEGHKKAYSDTDAAAVGAAATAFATASAALFIMEF